jgi:hypothetical protein
MRRILVESARRRNRKKHGGGGGRGSNSPKWSLVTRTTAWWHSTMP